MAPSRRKAQAATSRAAVSRRRRVPLGQTASMIEPSLDDEDELAIKPGEFVVDIPVSMTEVASEQVAQHDVATIPVDRPSTKIEHFAPLFDSQEDEIVLPSDEDELQALTDERGEDWIERVKSRRLGRAFRQSQMAIQEMDIQPQTQDVQPNDRQANAEVLRYENETDGVAGIEYMPAMAADQRPAIQLQTGDAETHRLHTNAQDLPRSESPSEAFGFEDMLSASADQQPPASPVTNIIHNAETSETDQMQQEANAREGCLPAVPSESVDQWRLSLEPDNQEPAADNDRVGDSLQAGGADDRPDFGEGLDLDEPSKVPDRFDGSENDSFARAAEVLGEQAPLRHTTTFAPITSASSDSQDPLKLLSSPPTARAARSEPSQRSRSRSVTPTSGAVSLSNLAPRRVSPPSSPNVPQPAALSSSPPPPPPPAQPALDPALYAFQAARTFRKRTAIQLQPYTREKQKYTEIVRRGGTRLIRELMHDDPDKAALKAQEEQQDSQFVVEDAADASVVEQDESLIQEEEEEEQDSLPVQPTEQDRQEFADLHRELADDDFDARLQAIAKARVRQELQEKRQKARDARIERKLRLELERKAQEKRREEQAAKKAERDRRRQERRLAEIQSSPEQPMRHSHSVRRSSAVSMDIEGARHAVARLTRIDSPISSPAPSDNEFDGDFGDGGFEDVNDPGDPALADALPPSSNDSTPNDDSLPPVVNPKKAKVLNRMLPAHMVKRLADAEKRKIAAEKAKMAADRRLSVSPRKAAGVARVRKAARQRGDESLNGFYVEQPGEDENVDAPPLNIFEDDAIPVAPVYADVDAISEDNETIMTVSSDSEEDGTESLNLLRAGNFTRLLNGERKAPKADQSKPRRLLRQALEPKCRRGPLKQTHLNFNAGKSPSRPRLRKRKGRGEKTTTRPRVMLDDDTIFEDHLVPEQARLAKPALHQSRVIPPVTPGPAPLKRQRVDLPDTPSSAPGRSSPTPVGLDLVGPVTQSKNSLWSDEYDFQIDFDVKPLPSGIDASRALPTTNLVDTIAWLVNPTACEAGTDELAIEISRVSLSTDMESSDLLEAMNSAGESIRLQFVDAVNEQVPLERLELKPLLHFVCHLVRRLPGPELLKGIAAALETLIDGAHALPVKRVSKRMISNRTILEAQWDLLHTLVQIERAFLVRGEDGADIQSKVEHAIRQLLTSILDYGFDKTMRPLKKVMSGEALDGSISEQTVGLWIALRHLVDVRMSYVPTGSSLLEFLDRILQGEVGVRHCEKVWYLIFGTAAIAQFGPDGKTGTELAATPAWHLVRTALKAISIPALTEAEEMKMRSQLKGRDKYIKILVMRCLQLSCVWEWRCDRASFPIATKDLGTIFRDRQHRNLPSESSSDFPEFVVQMDLSKTDDLDYDDSAYNLYLRFICISASDMIELAGSIDEAQSAVKEVQRLMLAIFPSSSVSSQHVARRMTSLINRYSTVIVAALFVPGILLWLVNNASKWVDLSKADVTIRSIAIRGLMYLGVVARHHAIAVVPVVDRLATIFDMIVAEKLAVKPDDPQRRQKVVEANRQLVLVVAAFRYIIENHSFKREGQEQPVFPDPALLHKSWTSRLTSREMVTDRRSGHEIIDCIQAFLESRQRALQKSKVRSRTRRAQEESQSSEFSEMGIDFEDDDLFALDGGDLSPKAGMDAQVAQILHERISPGIYEMMSNTLSERERQPLGHFDEQDKDTYITRLTRCWVDCATILVKEHHLREWAYYMEYGTESWERFIDERGKRKVGFHFMLRVAQVDPRAILVHSHDFILLFCQALISEDRTVEPQYAEALLQMPESERHPLLSRLDFRADRYFTSRIVALRGLFANMYRVLSSPGRDKPFVYRCATVIVSSMLSQFQHIPEMAYERRVDYAAFCNDVVGVLRREAGSLLTEIALPKLKSFPLKP